MMRGPGASIGEASVIITMSLSRSTHALNNSERCGSIFSSIVLVNSRLGVSATTFACRGVMLLCWCIGKIRVNTAPLSGADTAVI